MMNIQDKSAMPNLAGIFYPTAFQVTNQIAHMSSVYLSSPDFQALRYKNLELGGWDLPIVANEKKTLYAALDGTILNAPALRTELEKLGYRCLSEQPEELIIYAYEAWQEECLKRFNGPFALAIWDAQKEELLLARDRIGQKVLYWSDQGDHWLFSTQLKGLLATGLVAQNPSLTAFASYLHFGFVPQDLSLIHDVNKLLPGHYIKINLKRHWVISQHTSLSGAYDKQQQISYEQASEGLGEVLHRAVDRLITPERELGSLLSHNLGASSLNWFLAKQAKREQIRPFCAGFDARHLSHAELLGKELNLDVAIEHLDLSSTLSSLVEAIWHLDEPLTDPYLLRTWASAKLVHQLAPYAITPLGWEELLAGHPRFFSYGLELGESPPLAHSLANLPKWARDECLLPLLRKLHVPYRFNILRNVDINRQLVSFLIESGLFTERARRALSPNLKRYFNLEVFSQRFHRLTNLPGSQLAALYFDLKTILPDFYLHQYNRLFACQKVETLHPFLDNQVVDFVTSLPEEIIFKENLPGGLLRHLMQRIAPSLPNSTPIKDHFYATWGASDQLRHIFKTLEEGRLVEEGLISKKWLHEQVNYPDLTPLAFKQLWSILTLEIWFRLFINRPIGMQPFDISVEELLGVKTKVPEIVS